MGKSNLQCFLCILVLYSHFPAFQSYHRTMCIGTIDNMTNSIGRGTEDYHNNRLAKAAATAESCFDDSETVQNTWTPNYILYNSPDFHDTTVEGNVLFGWISVSITVPNGAHVFIVNPSVRNDRVQFVPGEIVTTRLGGSCQENFHGQRFPKLNLAPCYFVSNPSTMVGVAAAYSGSLLKNLKFTFRADFPECAAMHEKSSLEFRFYANRQRPIHSSCPEVRMFTSPQNQIHVKDITYGGYDPEPPRESGKVSCGTHLNSAKGWVLKYEGSVLKPNNYPEWPSDTCYAYNNTSNNYSFTGRCSYENSQTTIFPNNTYKCNPETPQKEGIPYVPENPPNIVTCEGCQEARNRTRTLGMACASTIGQNIWGLRTTHGIAMAWVAMAIIPLSTLLSRYYKETLMKYRYVNVHVWHGVHTAAAFTGFAGLLSGWVAALTGRLYFGFSRNGVGYLHWMLGYLSILSFLVAFFGSSVRIFEERWRLRTIFFHFLAGTITRVCWTICLLTSIYIPGSPAASSDAHISGFTLEPAVAIIIPWIIVDVAVHVLLMVNLKSTDKKAKFLTRTYAIAVPIPLIKPEDEMDFPGAGLKKIALCVHTAVGILCASLLSVLICLTGIEGRYFGQMWYTHKDSGKLNMVMKDIFYD